ncbi:hypothetical protein B296_00025163 [Ensete ventricosum]|uniref:Uncharacterized protein n=1 Tax=Ensete ventricosum TaxID=4639 RepID=A0A427ATE2_ENSVE|nr:hypothetical protein B296_00025163 [Ensete ventricosum]
MDSMRQRGRLRFLAFVVDELWRGTDVLLSCSISICARTARGSFDGGAVVPASNSTELRLNSSAIEHQVGDVTSMIACVDNSQLEGCEAGFWVSAPIHCVGCRKRASTHARFPARGFLPPKQHPGRIVLDLISSSACFRSLHPSPAIIRRSTANKCRHDRQ